MAFENFNYGDETNFIPKKKLRRPKGISSSWYRDHPDEEKHGDHAHHSMNFEKYAADGQRFIREVAFELDSDENKAARVTRAVLHAIRDRIDPDDAIEFLQGLPMILKGIFIDQYDPSIAPVKVRNPHEFLEFVRGYNKRSAPADFPDSDSVIKGLRAVFRVLERTMDYGQVQEVKNLLNKEIAQLIGP